MRIPAYVPEFYRSRVEEKERQREKERELYGEPELDIYYKTFMQKLDWARYLKMTVMHNGGYEKCKECKYKIPLKIDADDDTNSFICTTNGWACRNVK